MRFYTQNSFPFRVLLYLTHAILLSFFVSQRDISVGVDTEQYIAYFYSVLTAEDIVWRYEPGFSLIVYFSSVISSGPVFLFFLVSFILTLVFLACFEVLLRFDNVEKKSRWLTLFFLFSFLLFLSSWYFNAVVNGLRQGLALSFIYFAVLFMATDSRKLLKLTVYTLFSFLALSFHYSVFFLILSSFLLLLSNKKFFSIWIFSAFIYAFGFSSEVVKYTSNLIGVPLFDAVMSYGSDDAKYSGFNLAFFCYTIFWPFLFFVSSKVLSKFINRKNDFFVYVLKVYCCFCLPYFALGFGPFSNRYAVMAWAFLPFLQLAFLKSLRLNARVFFVVFMCLFYFSFVYFIFFRLQFFDLVT